MEVLNITSYGYLIFKTFLADQGAILTFCFTLSLHFLVFFF